MILYAMRVILPLTLLASLSSCASMVYTNGVPNLQVVEPGLYRGGAPRPEGWQYLQTLGVKTVIKLNFDHEGSDQAATALGLTVIYLPFPPDELLTLFGGPTPAIMREIQAKLADPSLRPLYFHCTHGQDRTGLTAGIYRVQHDHWPKSKAWREMRQLGYHELLFGLTDFWHDHVPAAPASQP